MKIFYKNFISIAIILLISQLNFAQSSAWTIISPQTKTAKSGELFFNAKLTNGEKLSSSLTKVFVNEKDITSKSKIQNNSVSFVYLNPLLAGNHRIIIIAKDSKGKEIETLVWNFKVIGFSKGVSKIASLPKKYWLNGLIFSGRTDINSRSGSINGSGSELRQEPSSINNFNFTGLAEYKSFQIPIRIFTTNEESENSQPKNRFQIGLVSNYFELYFGDTNVSLDELVLSGSRVRGFDGKIRYKKFSLEFAKGEIQRGVEGEVFKYDPTTGFPPANLREDSTYVVGGNFQRNITSGRIAFGTENQNEFGLSFFKAKDDTSSIENGDSPKENFVVGSDLTLEYKKNNNFLRFESGAAISITTDDISNGAISKADVDSLFDESLPFDPKEYEDFFTINISTYPVRIYEGSSTAYFGRGKFQFLTNLFTAEYKRIGTSYNSFGNDFLRNDRKGYTLKDRFSILKRKVTTTVSFENYDDNLSNNQTTSRNTKVFSGNLLVFPRIDLPSFSLLIRNQKRKSAEDSLGVRESDDSILTFNFGINYNFKAFSVRHGVNLNFSNSERSDKINSTSENSSRTLGITLTEQFNFPLIINISYINLNVESKSLGTLQSQNSLSTTFRYKLKSYNLDLNLRLKNDYSSKTQNSDFSNRFGAELRAKYTFLQNMAFESSFGLSSFNTKGNEKDYTELFMYFRYTYGFSFQ